MCRDSILMSFFDKGWMDGVLDVRLGMYGCMDGWYVRTTRLIPKLSDGWIISRVVVYR
jgi:hypothetical protein